jgi:hypothetical protein
LAGDTANERKSMKICNVRDYGAGGKKAEDAGPFIQKAVDACAGQGGGMVYLPPGEYTSGTIRLRSHVRFHLEAGATLYSAPGKERYHPEALLFGENLENVSIEGRGTIDGQGRYEWRLNDHEDRFIWDNQKLMEKLGKPLTRAFPKKECVGKLILLLRCRDVQIRGLSLIDSPSWTIHPYGCERLLIDGVYISTSLKAGVWADGIDPDGCRDVRIANCTIETGDDAIVFYSMNWFGPALPCENITITNCRLSSSSAAIKFCDGNMNCVRNVTIDNCVITDSNRGLAFMVFDGGYVSDVLISNLTIECRRRDWFWWGDGDPIHFNIKRRGEVHPQLQSPDEPPAGSIRNVLIRDVVARGQGTCGINGHPDSRLENIAMENVELFVSADPEAPYDKTTHAMSVRWARDFRLRDVAVRWEEPASEGWLSALRFEDVHDLTVEGFRGRQAGGKDGAPAVALQDVRGGRIHRCRAEEGTGVFLELAGRDSRDVRLSGSDLRRAEKACRVDDGADAAELHRSDNLLP